MISNNNKLLSAGMFIVETRLRTLNLGPYTSMKWAFEACVGYGVE
jgi:hypothetical protein